MAQMIKCDKCKKIMPYNARDYKGYCEFVVNYLEYTDHPNKFHLCKECYTQFFSDFLKEVKG